jgi:hypothetical protein
VSSVEVTEWEPSDEEQLGTKPKQWLRDPGGALWLWKESTTQRDRRHGAFRKGDDWSEVVAGRLGRNLGVPVADVELATRGDLFGVVSRSVLTEDSEILVHGNELLAETGVNVPMLRDRSGYTVEAVASALEGVGPPLSSDVLTSAFDWFAGYLVLDALVGNTDRHQDNWATIRGSYGERLSPSFDHASCLAFQVSDAERVERLTSLRRDRDAAAYVAAARTKFEGGPTPKDAALAALALASPAARSHWSAVVERAPMLAEVLVGLPVDRMSEPARQFAEQLYEANRTLLSDPLRTMTP